MVMDAFLLKVLLSFLVGGLYIAFTIWVSEKFGSKIGGIIIGLPSTVLMSLLFLAWTKNTSAAVAAIPIVPVAVAVNCLFVVAFIFFYKYGQAMALLVSLLVWFALTLPLVLWHIDNIQLSLILSAVYFLIAVLLLHRFPHRKLERFSFAPKIFFFRTVFSGMIVALAVYLGTILNPLWGGLFGSFPAAFSSSMLLITKAHNIDFAASVARTMPYGSIGNAIFAIAFFFLVPAYGLFIGTVLAYLSSLITAVILYKSIR
ncbi:DUF3147 family protein [Candidatus Woesearchaeota archaeon]|nr:DUF3147 family protein [Candidatus Woesearchaeota archaeon]